MCCVKAIELAAKLDLSSYLSPNFLPDAIHQHQRCIRTILAAAEKHGLPVVRIMFELTQIERISDSGHIKCFVDYYRTQGFKIATDDLMKEGDKFRFFIHPDLGYGNRAAGRIEPGSLLIFEVELLQIES